LSSNGDIMRKILVVIITLLLLTTASAYVVVVPFVSMAFASLDDILVLGSAGFGITMMGITEVHDNNYCLVHLYTGSVTAYSNTIATISQDIDSHGYCYNPQVNFESTIKKRYDFVTNNEVLYRQIYNYDIKRNRKKINGYVLDITPTNIDIDKIYSFTEYNGVKIDTSHIMGRHVFPAHVFLYNFDFSHPALYMIAIVDNMRIDRTTTFIPVDYEVKAYYTSLLPEFEYREVYLARTGTQDCISKIQVKGKLSTDDVIELFKTAIDTYKNRYIQTTMPGERQKIRFDFKGEEYEAIFLSDGNGYKLMSVFPKSKKYLSIKPDKKEAYLVVKGESYKIIDPDGDKGICLTYTNTVNK